MFSISTILVGALLLLIQLVAALPWVLVAFFSRQDLRILRERIGPALGGLAGVFAASGVFSALYFAVFNSRDNLEISGRLYAAVLQLQLTIDLFILGFLLLLTIAPKGGAVALAAFREGVRQWLFWVIVGLAAVLMFVSIFFPYFTFGEDYLMVKQIGYDTIMLAAVLFGSLAACLSISEEIEGRTAITVMSKPVSRRQFMLGKFAGIILAALFMFGMLSVVFEGVLLVKHWWEK